MAQLFTPTPPDMVPDPILPPPLLNTQTISAIVPSSHPITVTGFARATPPQEGIIRETPKSTQPSPKAKLQPDSEDEEAPT